MEVENPFSVGLEIHVRLGTSAKIFCTCANRYGAHPNRHTCPVCLGLPGSLPVLNPEVLEPAVRLALALECTVNPISEFTRKNYFYPDLPRNYQITQHERPLATNGRFLGVGIERLHLEEDAGRSLHQDDGTLRVDLNRAGVPLAEIVTRPDLRDGVGARSWLGRLRQLVRALGSGDGDMEKGSLRVDANVGLAPGHPAAGAWVEIKNLNSLRHVEQAVDHEVGRLAGLLARGERLRRETRGWDPQAHSSSLLRRKEETAEYLFLPEPDLPLLRLDSARIAAVTAGLPERPHEREARWVQAEWVSSEDAVTLSRSEALALYFESAVSHLMQDGVTGPEAGAALARWILGMVLGSLADGDGDLTDLRLTPANLARLVGHELSGKITRAGILALWPRLLMGEDPEELIRVARGRQVGPQELVEAVREALATHKEEAARLQEGEQRLLNHFMGLVLKALDGRAEPAEVRDALLRQIENDAQK